MKTKIPDGVQTVKPLIIPVFIMNSGCPEACIYCNQKISAGDFPSILTRDLFNAEIESYLRWNRDKLRHVEIAFYGGSFTGLAVEYQKHLLDWAGRYLSIGKVAAIRVSTRPDLVDEDTAVFLKQHGVMTVEIGAQSFNDNVLKNAGRSHTAADTAECIRRLQKHGFTTGLHLMAGLPGDDRNGFVRSLEQTLALGPDMVRIHPLIVFDHTELANRYRQGHYTPLALDEAVDLCVLAWETLIPHGISIIRFGLQPTPEMSRPGAYLAGPLHPSFGSLVYGRIYLTYTQRLLDALPNLTGALRFEIAQADASHFRGPGNANLSALKALYPDTSITIEIVPTTKRGHLAVTTETGVSRLVTIPGMN